MSVPQKIYSEHDLTRARARAKRVGWLQGGGVVVGAAVVWNLLGWIPVVIALAAVAWVLYKVLGGGGDDDAGED